MAWFRTESEIRSRDGRLIVSGHGSVADVLERAVRDGENLSGANLRGQDLSSRSLAHARLECADLSGANLAHARLSRAVLEEANLSGAILRHASVEETNFRKACAETTDFGSASGREPDFMDANLTRADLSGASLPAAVFIRAKLSGAVMVELSAPNSVFRFATMERVELPGANLSRSDLANANLFRANLTKAIVAGASFEGARLLGAVLDGVDLGSAMTKGAEFGKRAGAGPGRRQLEALVAVGRFADALDAIGGAYPGRQTPAHVEFIAAMAHEGLGDFDRAAECYSRAGRTVPAEARYPRELARVLLVLGRPTEAAAAYAREAQLSPGQPLPVARAAAARAIARGASRVAAPVAPERDLPPSAARAGVEPTPAALGTLDEPESRTVATERPTKPGPLDDRKSTSMPAAWRPSARVPMSVSAWRDQARGRDLALVKLEAKDVPDETFGHLYGIARDAGGRYGRSPGGERGFILAEATAREFVSRFGAEILTNAPGFTPRERIDTQLTRAAQLLEESPPPDVLVGEILRRVGSIEEARHFIHEWLDGKLDATARDTLRSLSTDALLDTAARESEIVREALNRAGLGLVSSRPGHARNEELRGI